MAAHWLIKPSGELVCKDKKGPHVHRVTGSAVLHAILTSPLTDQEIADGFGITLEAVRGIIGHHFDTMSVDQAADARGSLVKHRAMMARLHRIGQL